MAACIVGGRRPRHPAEVSGPCTDVEIISYFPSKSKTPPPNGRGEGCSNHARFSAISLMTLPLKAMVPPSMVDDLTGVVSSLNRKAAGSAKLRVGSARPLQRHSTYTYCTYMIMNTASRAVKPVKLSKPAAFRPLYFGTPMYWINRRAVVQYVSNRQLACKRETS